VEVNRRAAFAPLSLFAVLALAGCGQKGALYLPGEARDIVTRPAQTPRHAEPATPRQPPPQPADAPNSRRTVDSPVGPVSPAPEVVAPESKEKDKNSTPKP